VLTEIKNRGVADVCIVVCDGLKGLPEAISTAWPTAITQTCIVHLPRNSFQDASKRDWAAIAKALKPVCAAASEAEAMERFLEFCEAWGTCYPAIVRLWENAWAEFVPFLAFDREIRTVICTTNAIESLNARVPPLSQSPRPLPHRAGRPQAPLPGDHQHGPGGRGRKRWTNRWKAALNAFDITFDGRLTVRKK
jgi:putative transposase